MLISISYFLNAQTLLKINKSEAKEMDNTHKTRVSSETNSYLTNRNVSGESKSSFVTPEELRMSAVSHLGMLQRTNNTNNTSANTALSTAPTCTTPISPADNETGVCGFLITIKWNPVAGATSYDVYVKDPLYNLLSRVSQQFVVGNQVSFAGFPDGVWQWKVIPSNADGSPADCPIWTFTTGDVIPPTITCPPNAIVSADANCRGLLGDYRALAQISDNCPINSPPQGVTQVPSSSTVLTTLNIPYTVQLYVNDNRSNNQSIPCSFTVTLQDKTPPTAVCKNPTVTLSDAGTASIQMSDVFDSALSQDNCGTVTPISLSQSMFSCADIGSKMVTLVVNDGNGNSSECTATVSVQASATPSVILNSSAPDNKICNGSTVVFTAVPTKGGSAPTYTWYINGSSQTETGATLQRSNLAQGDAIKVTLNSNETCLATQTAESTTRTMTVYTPSVEAGNCQFVYLGYGSNCTTITAVASGGAGGFTYKWSPINKTGATQSVCPTAPINNYTVIATDAFGCTATDVVTVEVLDVRCEKNKVKVCHNGLTICIATKDVTFHLAHGDKLGTCGASSNLCGTAANALIANEPKQSHNLVLPSDLDVQVYPNPANNVLTIQLDNITEGVTQFEIMDITGKVVKIQNKLLTEGYNEVTLDIQNLSIGLHFIKIKDSGNHEVVVKMSKM